MDAHKKSRYLLATLTGLILLQFGVLAVLRWVEIPYYEQMLIHEQVTLKDLELEKSKQYDKAGVTQALADYTEQSEKIKTFAAARQQVFVFSGEKFDFFPPVVSRLLPVIQSHLHNGVTLEGVAINEKAEVVMAVHAANYETLAVQYAALKSVFAKEPARFFKDIKLNTFTSQDTDITERNAKGDLVKRKSESVKATIAFMINPDFFPAETLTAVPVVETPKTSKARVSFLDRVQTFFHVIGLNIQRDIADLVGSGTVVNRKQEVENSSVIPAKAGIQTNNNQQQVGHVEVPTPPPPAPATPPVAVVKPIVTTVVPTFTWKGGAWVTVAKVLSSYLAAGKMIKAGDTVIDPHEAYTADELKKRAAAMMETILATGGFPTIRFHQVQFDPATLNIDTIDLVQLNTTGVAPK